MAEAAPFPRAPLLALAVAAFGIGTTELVIMGLLPDVAADLRVDLPAAGLLVSGYTLGVGLVLLAFDLVRSRGGVCREIRIFEQRGRIRSCSSMSILSSSCVRRSGETMVYAIKTEIPDPDAVEYSFLEQKTMYGGKHIAVGDTIYLFASENEGGSGLIARGIVVEAVPVPKKANIARQTPRVSLKVKREALAFRPLGRRELTQHKQWNDEKPETELNFKFYRQATNKVVGLSDNAATFLDGFFQPD